MASLVNKAKDMLGNNNDDTSHEQTSHNAYAGTETLPEAVKTGPVHNNEALNKIDPRVHEHKGTTTTAVNPKDASHVPPSVMQQHLGEPSIEHEFPHDSRHKRHSISHQEQHLMR